MPHVALVSFTGFRVREHEMLALGMTLPGLKPRAAAIAQLPTLSLLTLAGLTPSSWTCSYHESAHAEDLIEDVRRFDIRQKRRALPKGELDVSGGSRLEC